MNSWSVLLPGSCQFPQMVSVAKGMGAIVLKIRLPMIMTQYAFELGQNTHINHGIDSPFFMGIIKCPAIIGYAMQPMSFATNIDARFIGMCQI